MIYEPFTGTITPLHVATSIRRLPVLKGNFLMPCH